ncbi:MAG: ribosome biogenesis GTPase Der [Kiloniellales bacterium]|nr:ribosome biogenesis GTPase Der [Kiloniellales bacterium]
MPQTVAIVGRPNVGKSTLFNRLVRKRLALVHDQPGVTRDRREGEGRLYGLSFRVIDTAGFEDATDDSLEARMRAQTERALEAADLVLLLIDARAGVTPIDEVFARLLRARGRPVVLVANKCEGSRGEAGLLEAYSLGLGEPVALSAEHGLGLADLDEAVRSYLSADEDSDGDGDGDEVREADEEEDRTSAAARPEGPLHLAVVGRPNVGKSTLINRLLGEERLLTGPEAGITRDAIAVPWRYRGRELRLVDTAGLRRRARITERLEKISAADSLRALQFAQVVVLVVEAEASAPLEKQDLAIARQVVDEGRALVIALNKWDICADKAGARRALADRLARSLPQTRGVPVVTVSALRGEGLARLMDAVFAAYEVWNRRVPTASLNRWLAEVIAHHPPPAPAGRRIRLKYITQARTRPPTFAVSCSKPEALPASYLRYLENALREDFDLPGTPIRIHLKKSKSPFAPGT